MIDYSVINYSLLGNAIWMSWNLFLAFIPFLLATHLFKKRARQSAWWGLGVATFMLFLPNAPYIFTDAIHLYYAGLQATSPLVFSLMTLQFVAFFLAGYWLFAESYRRFEKYALRGRYHLRYLMRLVAFTTVSIGVYLGRFDRINSWDVLLKPHQVMTLVANNILDFNLYLFAAGFSLLLLLLYRYYEYVKTSNH